MVCPKTLCKKGFTEQILNGHNLLNISPICFKPLAIVSKWKNELIGGGGVT
jgi:hypothetical protein